MKETTVQPVADEIQEQMPHDLKPGSVLAHIRCPLSLIWDIAEAAGVSEQSLLYRIL